MNTTRSLLDEDVSNINTPLLKPKKYLKINNLIESSKEKANDLFKRLKKKYLIYLINTTP